MVFFFGGKFGFNFFLGLFLSCFCLVWGEQVTDAQDFGWQSKGEDYFRLWFPFFSCLLGDNFVLFRYCLVQRPFCTFLFLSMFDREFSFLFLLSPPLLIGNFLSLFSSESKDWHSHPGSRFMVSWDFGSRLVELLNMTYVRVWFGSGIKGMSHIISMTQMQQWWFGNFMQN